MRNMMLLSGLLVLIGGRPASAQNIWPVSFGYWFNCPDRHMLDFLGADQSIGRARALDRLCVGEIRGVMVLRSQEMSQQELARYNSPNMLPAIYPEGTSANHPAGGSPGGGSSAPRSRRGEGTSAPESGPDEGRTSPPLPPASRSPFRSEPLPASNADEDTSTAPLP